MYVYNSEVKPPNLHRILVITYSCPTQPLPVNPKAWGQEEKEASEDEMVA